MSDQLKQAGVQIRDHYFSGTSTLAFREVVGPGFSIRWAGAGSEAGARLETILLVLIDHLQFDQGSQPTAAKSRLISDLISAKERYLNERPTIGGALNDLIPKE